MANEPESWTPDWVVSPGEVLLETLQERQISQAELARRMDRPIKTVNEIIKGKAAVTPETAIQLERTLGISDAFWMGLETNYRRGMARQNDLASLASEVGFLSRFPVADMVRRGVIARGTSKPDQLDRLLKFLGFNTPQAWDRHWGGAQPALRQSPAYLNSPEAVAAWLRWGETRAEPMSLGSYDEQAFRTLLDNVRGWSRLSPVSSVLDRLARRCADVGVALVLTPELKGTHLNGAAYTTASGKRVVQLSLRHKRDDQLWFTFFHECGHVLLTPQQLVVDSYVSPEEPGFDVDAGELLVDTFARDLLLPPDELAPFVNAGRYDETSVRNFAQTVGVSAGVVVGRLQRDGLIPVSKLNHLKRTISWQE